MSANEKTTSILKIGEDDLIFSEQIKALRAKVEYRIDSLGFRLIAVTSAISGEGKTTLSAKLAANLASSGRKRILLIDTDMRKADLARGIGVPNKPGLSEYLLGSAEAAEIVHRPEVAGLHVIPAGARIDSPDFLLSGDKFRNFLKGLRDQYDIVLLDTPPILPVADTLNLRDQVDGFIFVYRATFTPYKMFAKAAEEIGESGIVGVVVNGVEPEPQSHYNKYYGSYYRKPNVSAASKAGT
jgi:capsular exopolysaccharide synthesis family protein